MAILPISFLLIFVIGVFFQQPTNAPGETAFGEAALGAKLARCAACAIDGCGWMCKQRQGARGAETRRAGKVRRPGIVRPA
jgi:hypothetical protein